MNRVFKMGVGGVLNKDLQCHVIGRTLGKLKDTVEEKGYH